MKRIGMLLCSLLLVMSMSNVKALQSEYSVNDMFMYDDYKIDDGKITILKIASFNRFDNLKYQFQPMSKEDQNNLLALEPELQAERNKLKETAETLAEEVANACGFEKEDVAKWCSGMGGPGCIMSTYDENTISDSCKTAITNYEPYRGKLIDLIIQKDYEILNKYRDKRKKLLPNIDNNKWLDTTDKISIPSSDMPYQVLFVKGDYDNSTYYYYAIVNTPKKTINEGLTDTKKDESKEETKVNEKNPKTGLYNNYMYGVGIVLVSAILYVGFRKVKKFSK